MLRHIDLEEINWVPDFSGREHGVNGSQDHPGNGNDSPLLSPARCVALIFQGVVRGRFVLYGGVGNLYQRRLEIDSGMRNADRFFLACGFVVARGQTGPAAKMFRGAELRHICTDFRDDGDGAVAVNARDGTEKGDISSYF